MVLMAVMCPYGQSDHITQRGKTETAKHRERGHTPHCPHQSFLLHPADTGRLPGIKAPSIALALNGSGIYDTARVVGLSPDTILNELKNRGQPGSRSISPYATWGRLGREKESCVVPPPKSTTCDPWCSAKKSRDGCGLRVLTAAGQDGLTCVSVTRTRCLGSAKPSWSQLA
jgi:transposase-like protein